MKQGVLRGVEVQSTRVRIPKEERDPNLFYYEMRHGDSESQLCTIENSVFVNFYGTVVSQKEIPLDLEKREQRTDINGNVTSDHWEGIHFDEPSNKKLKKSVSNRFYDKELSPWKEEIL